MNESPGFPTYVLHFGKSINNKITELIKFPPGKEIPREVQLEKAQEKMLKTAKHRDKQQKKISEIICKKGDLVLLRIPFQPSAIEREIKKCYQINFGTCGINKDYNNNAFY